jgi:hypothetical protein
MTAYPRHAFDVPLGAAQPSLPALVFRRLLPARLRRKAAAAPAGARHAASARQAGRRPAAGPGYGVDRCQLDVQAAERQAPAWRAKEA